MNKNLTQLLLGFVPKKIIALFFFFAFVSNGAFAQYCAAGATSTAFEKISNVTFAGINNNSTATAGYENFTTVSGNIFAGATLPISITLSGPFSSDQAFVWVDLNNNGAFTDAGELLFTSVIGSGPYTGNITIPGTAIAGSKRMRVRMHDSQGTTPNSTPCGDSDYGQVEDYTLNVNINAPCAGTPAPGSTIASLTSVCAGTPFTLSLQNATAGSGVTYQWQSAATAAGPFNPIATATGSTYTSAVPGGLFYRCVVTCAGNPGNSTPIQVNVAPSNQCYCTTSLASNTADEDIFNVTVSTLNNSSGCGTLAPGFGSILNRYSNYTSGTGAPAVPNVVAGANNPFSVQIGSCGGNFGNSTAIFIDLNQDGAFAATERVYVSAGASTGPHFETGVLVIPTSAVLGNTRMRVVNVETGTPGSITACGGYTWGETEDYTINLVACVPTAITVNPTSTSAVCGTTATFTSAATGTFPSYQWQYRTSATGLWQLVPNAAPYTGANTNTLTVAVNPALNGYQYRNSIIGACIGSALDATTAATLTVTPVVITVTQSAPTYCAGGTPVLLTVPNSTQTVTFNSSLGSGIFIPDGPASAGVPVPGVNTSLAVSGIPVGANILDISVKLNITHQYAGDVIATLKSPTSNATTGIICLFALLNGGTGSNATPNFTNTVISSNGVTALSGAAAPRTGTFKADGYITTAPPLAIAIPSNGGAANVNSWASLLSTPNANGNWTLYLADGGATDTGRINNWSIIITYGAAPATAVFSPATGLFTNAAATIPYVAGAAVGQVYAAPTINTTYSAVVTAGICTGAPQSIVVNANTAVGGTATLSNATLCQGGNATFALGGTLTGGPAFTHNYQVSTDNGVTFTNIANGGVYSGATTNTLVITGAPTSFNGYKYRDSINTVGGCGFLKSTVGALTVNATPTVTISAAPATALFPGLTSTVTATVLPTPSATTTYQWFRDGVAVSTPQTNNKTIVNVDGFGLYTVNVVDGNGCTTNMSTPSNILISDSARRNVLFIYPSPNTGKFQVRYHFDNNTSTSTNTSINIYDEKGTRVYTRAFNPGLGYGLMSIDLGTHGKGVYRVDLIDQNGTRLQTGSVMVF